MMNGSRNERWLEAKITGPLAGRARARSATAGSRGGRTAARQRAHEPVDERVDALARGRGRAVRRDPWVGDSSLAEAYPTRRGSLQLPRMALDRTRTLRGALAGAAAAAVWAAQQPLDKRVFGVDYDDVELLGTLRHARAGAG